MSIKVNKNKKNHEDYYVLNITRYVDSYGIFAMEQVVDPASMFK